MSRFSVLVPAVCVAALAASAAPAKAGAISTTSARVSYPTAGARVITGTGNIFLGTGETFMKVEMLVWRIDGTVVAVPASRTGPGGLSWGGSYTWFQGNSGTTAAIGVKGRLTYRDRFGVQRVYTESAWKRP
ncbi:MAG TPA: hypothetical protein VD866_04445 [Urbifossiella sp.]|nr:hypothetical protein [Urbifossiella sp.]